MSKSQKMYSCHPRTQSSLRGDLLACVVMTFFSTQSEQPPHHLLKTRQGDTRRGADERKMKIHCLPNQGPMREIHDPKPLAQDHS